MKQENINYNFRTVDKERIEEYFNTGRVSVNDLNKDGQSPLFYAVQRPHDGEDIVKLLLDNCLRVWLGMNECKDLKRSRIEKKKSVMGWRLLLWVKDASLVDTFYPNLDTDDGRALTIAKQHRNHTTCQ